MALTYTAFDKPATIDAVVDHVEALDIARSVRYVHTDHPGSTDVVSDKGGDIVARMSFDVRGERRDAEDWTLPDEFAELGGLNLGYTGHAVQLDGDLVNMRGRLYDPHIGRMASADPLVVAPTSTQGGHGLPALLWTNEVGRDPNGARRHRTGRRKWTFR